MKEKENSISEIHILHVDDDRQYLNLLKDGMELLDHDINIINTTSPLEAPEIVENRDIDCVLSDYQMDDMNGLELLEELRSENPDLPFILLTGKGSEKIASEAISKGATDYFRKKTGKHEYKLIATRIENAVEKYRAVREKEKTLKRINDAFFGLDTDWNFTYVNQKAEELMETPKEELQGQKIWEVFSEVKGTLTEEKFREAMEEQKPVSYQRHSIFDKWFHITVYPSETGLSVYFRDITERKEREERLGKFETMIKTIEDSIYLIDSDHKIRWINSKGAEMVDYTRDELIGASVSKISKQKNIEEMDRLQKELEKGDRSTGVYREKFLNKEGNEIPVEIRFTPYEFQDGSVGRLGIARNITEKNRQNKQLEKFENILDTIDDGVYVTNQNFEFERVNTAFADLLKTSREDLIGTRSAKFLPEEERDKINELIDSMMKDDRDIETHRGVYMTSEGQELPIENRFKLLTTDDGEFNGTVGVVRDRTEQKKTEGRKEEELNEYRELVESASESMFILDTDLKLQKVNSAVEDFVEVERDELEGEPVDTLAEIGIFDKEEFRRRKTQLMKFIDNPEKDEISFKMEIKPPGDRDSKYSRMQITKVYNTEDEITGLTGVAHDITEMEEKRQEQLERLDEFSSLVSHDLRNPLNLAQGYLDLARESEDEEDYEVIEKAHGRMEDIIEEIMIITAEQDSIDRTEFDLKSVFEEAYYFAGNTRSDYTVDETCQIYGDRSGAISMFENLIKNSIEHNKGEINIEIGAVGDGFYYEDDGKGIDKDMRNKVFEYGYSSSEEGRGLGLSIVKRIAEINNWRIKVGESDEGGLRLEFHPE